MSKGMSINKWRVRKLAFPDGAPVTFPWYVIPPGMPTPQDVYEAYEYSHYERITAWRSHRMALLEALDESRKV